MYNAIYYDRKGEILHLFDDTYGYICKKYKDFAFRKKRGGMYRSLWGDELEKTISFDFKDSSLFESDLPVETKILIDLYRDDDKPAKKNSIIFFDIETDSTGGFANIESADKEITAITLYDVTVKKYHTLILNKTNAIENIDINKESLKSFQTEQELLKYFLTLWEEISPTIVSAWNGDGFDFPYIVKRISVVLGDTDMKRLSPIGVVFYNTKRRKVVIGCVSCLDYMVLYKKFRFEPRPQYNLNFIGEVELGKGKIKFEGSLNDLYKTDIKKYIEYNKFDVELLCLLDEKFKFIELAVGICHVGHIPYEWFHMSSRFIEGAIIIYMRKHGNLVASNKPVQISNHCKNHPEDSLDVLSDDDADDIVDDVDTDGIDISDNTSFEGAYVKEPIPGLYEYVISADINSLYPSCIRTINISPETYMGKIINWDIDEYMQKTEKDYKIGELVYTHETLKDFLVSNNIIIAANGAMFDGETQGIIPAILDQWFSQRVEFKSLSKKYSKEGNLELAEFYDRRQHIQKIFLNSVYGILGLRSGRFYSKDNAEAVTISGQNIIRTTEKIVISFFKEKYKKYETPCINEKNIVVYIDTDSVYVSLAPLIELEDIKESDKKSYSIQTANEIVNNINDMYKILSKRFFNSANNKIKIVGESLCDTAFWIAKKKYSLHIIHNIDDKKDVMKIKTKGIEFIKSSFPIKFSEFGNNLMMSILQKKNKTDIDNNILTFVENLATFSPKDIAKNTSVKFFGKNGNKIINFDDKKRNRFSFLKRTTAQAKAALAYNDFLVLFKLTKKIEPIYSGSKIKWVYLKDNPYNLESLAFKSDGTDPNEIMDIINTYVDRTGLYKHEMKKKLESFYKALKWEFPEKSKINASKLFG